MKYQKLRTKEKALGQMLEKSLPPIENTSYRMITKVKKKGLDRRPGRERMLMCWSKREMTERMKKKKGQDRKDGEEKDT